MFKIVFSLFVVAVLPLAASSLTDNSYSALPILGEWTLNFSGPDYQDFGQASQVQTPEPASGGYGFASVIGMRCDTPPHTPYPSR